MITSGQRILTKVHITRAEFSHGKFNAMPDCINGHPILCFTMLCNELVNSLKCPRESGV